MCNSEIKIVNLDLMHTFKAKLIVKMFKYANEALFSEI